MHTPKSIIGAMLALSMLIFGSASASNDPVVANPNTGENFNRYAYANNNPYKFTDPDGRNPVAGAAVGCAVTGPACPAGAVIGAVIGAAIGVAAVLVYNEVAEDSTSPQSTDSRPTEDGNSNPYNGPVNEPVVVVDGDGNAIPVGQNEQITSSPDGRFQQVRGADGRATGVRLDKGGHPRQADPRAQAPHGHQPGRTDGTGNPHLPLNEPKRPDPGL